MHAPKLKPNSRKGVFLGYVPHTTCNILWYDTETSRIKIATHAQFDMGMNDLPVTDMPPNVTHLVRTNNGQPVAPDVADLHASHFAFDIVPFVPIFTRWLKHSNSINDTSFGLKFEDDPILHCPFVSDIAKLSASLALCSLHKATCQKLLGAYALEIIIIVYSQLPMP